MPAYYFAKKYSGKEYINDRDQIILMKFDKALVEMYLMYVTIWEPNQRDINNISRIMIILYRPCNPALIENEL